MIADSAMEFRGQKTDKEKDTKLSRRALLAAAGLSLLGVMPAMAQTVQEMHKELRQTRKYLAYLDAAIETAVKTDRESALREYSPTLNEKETETKTIRDKIVALNIKPPSEEELARLSKETGFSLEEVRSYSSPTLELSMSEDIFDMIRALREKLEPKK